MSPVTADRQKLIDRITKLLALADNAGAADGEAANAARMAQELMAKHDISIGTIENCEFVVVKDATGRQAKANYEITLYAAIASINGVAMLTGTGYYKYIGRSADIEAFRYMLDIVLHQRTAAWKLYFPVLERLNRGVKPTQAQHNKWKMGFAFGVTEKIHALMRASEQQAQEWGLTVVPPHKQALAWYKQDNKVTSTKGRAVSYSSAGYAAGSDVSLNKGVGNNAGARIAIGH